jgi:hypothetical protein
MEWQSPVASRHSPTRRRRALGAQRQHIPGERGQGYGLGRTHALGPPNLRLSVIGISGARFGAEPLEHARSADESLSGVNYLDGVTIGEISYPASSSSCMRSRAFSIAEQASSKLRWAPSEISASVSFGTADRSGRVILFLRKNPTDFLMNRF